LWWRSPLAKALRFPAL